MFRLWRRWFARWLQDAHGTVHFVTWHLDRGQIVLTPSERDLVCRVLRSGEGERYRLLAFVVMDDHVHVLVQPTGIAVDRLTHSWKSFTAHELQRLHRRAGSVWRQECLDRVVATGQELRQKAEYIVGNPWKRWPFIRRYAWVWEAGEPASSETTAPHAR